MTNEELCEIDAEIARVEAGNGAVHSKFWIVKLLRAQLADAERRISELETDLCQAYERVKRSTY